MSDPISLGKGRAVGETKNALLVRFQDSPKARLKGAKVKADDQLWIPQSVIHDDSEVYASGQVGNVVVETWWAEERGFA